MRAIGWFAGFVAFLGVAAAADAPLEKAQFNCKLRGYFYAYSEKVTGPGGHGKSDNFPKKAAKGLVTEPGVRFVIGDETGVAFAKKFEGRVVRLVNATRGNVVFSAMDSRLPIVAQALSGEGDWQDIEYLPKSFCGNSYHTLELPAGHCWEFVAPRYRGETETKLRYKLTMDGGKVIYSEAFEGSIQAKQFLVKQGHVRRGVMDPYAE